jgi:hypothetical protein
LGDRGGSKATAQFQILNFECKNCKRCHFHKDNLSFTENAEYKVILSNNNRKKWVTAYLFNTYVQKLINNYA